MVRITEHNDWVIFCILAGIIVYIFLLRILQREANLPEFILQNYRDSSNTFLSWILVSAVYITLFSVLFSQYLPIIPKIVTQMQIAGYHLNKFGYILLLVSIFYAVKTGFSYLFYKSIDDLKNWKHFYFSATKFYFVISLLLMIGCTVHYYFNIEKSKILYIYMIFMAFSFIFKNLFYLFNKNQILPNIWYYKFLYICTLQITPVLVLWKLLFF